MDYHAEAVLFVSRVLSLPVFERLMRVFFGKRTTGFPVLAISFLAFPVVMSAMTVLLLSLGELPVVLTLVFISAPSVALMLVMTLNYEGTWKKRLVAAVSIFAVGIAINYALTILLGAYIPLMGATALPRQSIAHLALEMGAWLSIMLTLALLLQNFKSIRKNVAVLPVVWVSILAIPLSSAAVTIVVAHAPDMPAGAQVLAICVLLGINVLAFYLHDRLSAAHARELRSALHAQEKEYYLAQCRLAEESLEQAKSARGDMAAHFAALKDIADRNRDGELAGYLDKLIAGAGSAEPSARPPALPAQGAEAAANRGRGA